MAKATRRDFQRPAGRLLGGQGLETKAEEGSGPRCYTDFEWAAYRRGLDMGMRMGQEAERRFQAEFLPATW